MALKIVAIFREFDFSEIKLNMRDVCAKMREFGKKDEMRDFPHDYGMVDTYEKSVCKPKEGNCIVMFQRLFILETSYIYLHLVRILCRCHPCSYVESGGYLHDASRWLVIT